MNIRYEIEIDTNAVKIFYNNSDVCSLYQPTYPDGSPWESREKANEWAVLFVNAEQDFNNPLPPIGPGLEPTYRSNEINLDLII